MRRAVSIFLIVAAIALMVAGICDEQFQQVLVKASKVCLECVGIG